MFGYIVVNQPELKIKDYDCYRSFYCGLCQCLKRDFSQVSRLALNFDLTFVALLLTALYEPETKQEHKRCLVHPLTKHVMVENEYIHYAADMTIVLTYLKCEDNWIDEHKVSSNVAKHVLAHHYARIQNKYPKKIKKIEEALVSIHQLEDKKIYDLDRLSSLTGAFMAEILCYKEDEWSVYLRKMGDYLGRFIYLLDAYDDLYEDKKKGCFNPLVEEEKKETFEDRIRMILEMMIATSCEAFEMLPIVEYQDILRNILYSGVWSKFELTQKDRLGEKHARSV